MTGRIEFTFEELPLVVDLGFEAGLVNGLAEIKFEDTGEWFVREIWLDGFRRRTAAEMDAAQAKEPGSARLPLFERRPVQIDRADRQWLYLAIMEQLESGRFKVTIEDLIQQAMDDNADDSGTRRPDPNAKHSTLNPAQQGA